jgi:cell division septal protein FtsQ
MAGKRAKPKDADATPPELVAEPTPAPKNRAALRITLKVVAALALVAVFVAGLAWVGERAGLQLLGNPRYQVKVADIQCDTPPGLDRTTFLTEIRYLSDLPATVSSVDPALSKTLTAAFAKHPWVAGVDGVEVVPEAGIRVNVRFRVPVLAVDVMGESDRRAVDRDGVLLPSTASVVGLPVLLPAVHAPTTLAGEVWSHPDVKRAVELAQAYPALKIEKTAKGWRITTRDDRVLSVGG